MAYYIAAPCVEVKDMACVEVCPVDCIHPSEGESMLFINPNKCIDCGACESECPVKAIFAEEDLPAEWRPYIKINTKYFELQDSPQKWEEFKKSKAEYLTKKE